MIINPECTKALKAWGKIRPLADVLLDFSPTLPLIDALVANSFYLAFYGKNATIEGQYQSLTEQ